MKHARHKTDAEDRVNITPLLLDANAVAAILSVSRAMVFSMMSTSMLGPLPIRLGKRTLWRYEELAAWVRAGCPRREVWLKMAQEQGFGHQGGQRY